MKALVIILIALVASYLTGVGIYNDWNIFTELDPTGCVSVIAALCWLAFCYGFVAWAVLTELFEL